MKNCKVPFPFSFHSVWGLLAPAVTIWFVIIWELNRWDGKNATVSISGRDPGNPPLITAPSAPQPFPDLIRNRSLHLSTAQLSMAEPAVPGTRTYAGTHTHVYPTVCPIYAIPSGPPTHSQACRSTSSHSLYPLLEILPRQYFFPPWKSCPATRKQAWKRPLGCAFLITGHVLEILREACSHPGSLISIHRATLTFFFSVCFKAFLLSIFDLKLCSFLFCPI